MMFAAKTNEVPNFGKKLVKVANREILLVNVKGTIYACENECPHQGAPMTAAIVTAETISCPRHGYRFSLADGSCAEHPECVLAMYPVTIQGDDILVTVE